MKNIEHCYNLMLEHIMQSLEDKYCFYRYQIADKTQDEEGKSSNYIKEQLCQLFNVKAAKDTMDVLQKLSEKINAQDTSQTGVIFIPELDTKEE